MFRLFILLAILAASCAFQPLPQSRLCRPIRAILSVKAEDDRVASDENRIELDRRVFVGYSLATLLASTTRASPSYAAESSSVDYKAVAADIADLVKKNESWGPTLVRLAWHSSGTYDASTKTGGSGGGTIRFKEELAHGGNAGLSETAVQWLEPVKARYKDISYADLYTLAGVSAIKAMGGPTIPWSSGRVDALDASAVTPDGRLPNADVGPKGAEKSDAQHLRDIFYRMGELFLVVFSVEHVHGF